MTNKEIADRLREINSGNCADQRFIAELINELDPPNPKPGPLVWWRWHDKRKFNPWQLGKAHKSGVFFFGNDSPFLWEHICWRAARILQPGQVAVDVPTVSEWGTKDKIAEVVWRFYDGMYTTRLTKVKITRAEAEAMDVER